MTTYVAAGKCKVQYVVTNEWKATLEERAKAEDLTMTDIVVKAVNQYEEREARKAERRQTRTRS